MQTERQRGKQAKREREASPLPPAPPCAPPPVLHPSPCSVSDTNGGITRCSSQSVYVYTTTCRHPLLCCRPSITGTLVVVVAAAAEAAGWVRFICLCG